MFAIPNPYSRRHVGRRNGRPYASDHPKRIANHRNLANRIKVMELQHDTASQASQLDLTNVPALPPLGGSWKGVLNHAKRRSLSIEAEQKIQQALQSGATELDLSDMKLTELPESIGQLKQLRKLDLGHD